MNDSSEGRFPAIASDQPQELSEREAKFLLAYAGIEPAAKGVRTAAQAFRCIEPDATDFAANVGGKRLLQRLKTKGLLSLFLELRGLGIASVSDALHGGLHAEKIQRVDYPGGLWDYAFVPDTRERRRTAELILQLHNVITPAGVVEDGSTGETFADAVRRQQERKAAERHAALSKRGPIEAAQFTEIKPTEGTK